MSKKKQKSISTDCKDCIYLDAKELEVDTKFVDPHYLELKEGDDDITLNPTRV